MNESLISRQLFRARLLLLRVVPFDAPSCVVISGVHGDDIACGSRGVVWAAHNSCEDASYKLPRVLDVVNFVHQRVSSDIMRLIACHLGPPGVRVS